VTTAALPSIRQDSGSLTEWLQSEFNASLDGRQRWTRLSHKNDLLPGAIPKVDLSFFNPATE
jgi:hypothetical protein